MRSSPFLQLRFAAPIAIIALFFLTALHVHAQAVITPSSVVQVTNSYRTANGESPLKTDPTLSKIAQERLNDMFRRQYFAHVDPDGNQVDVYADDLGYQYVDIGENLALGTYADTNDLMDAWMNSSGHRANILRTQYTVIGVAVGTGMFQGEESLIAVQVFARPLTSCSAPSSDLRASITESQSYIERVSSVINAYMHAGSSLPGMSGILNQVSSLMAIFNTDLNQKVAEYNKEVQAYQTCLRG